MSELRIGRAGSVRPGLHYALSDACKLLSALLRIPWPSSGAFRGISVNQPPQHPVQTYPDEMMFSGPVLSSGRCHGLFARQSHTIVARRGRRGCVIWHRSSRQEDGIRTTVDGATVERFPARWQPSLMERIRARFRLPSFEVAGITPPGNPSRLVIRRFRRLTFRAWMSAHYSSPRSPDQRRLSLLKEPSPCRHRAVLSSFGSRYVGSKSRAVVEALLCQPLVDDCS